MGFLCGWCNSSEALLFFGSIFCHSFADLQQRQLIRDLEVAVVPRLLQEASGKIFWHLLLQGTSVACCCRSGQTYGGICLCQHLQTAFVGCLQAVDYLCTLLQLTVESSSVKHSFDECLRRSCITGGQECSSQRQGRRES